MSRKRSSSDMPLFKTDKGAAEFIAAIKRKMEPKTPDNLLRREIQDKGLPTGRAANLDLIRNTLNKRKS